MEIGSDFRCNAAAIVKPSGIKKVNRLALIDNLEMVKSSIGGGGVSSVTYDDKRSLAASSVQLAPISDKFNVS